MIYIKKCVAGTSTCYTIQNAQEYGDYENVMKFMCLRII